MPLRRSVPPTSGAAGQGSRLPEGSPISVATSTSPGPTVVPGARHSRAIDRLMALYIPPCRSRVLPGAPVPLSPVTGPRFSLMITVRETRGPLRGWLWIARGLAAGGPRAYVRPGLDNDLVGG